MEYEIAQNPTLNGAAKREKKESANLSGSLFWGKPTHFGQPNAPNGKKKREVLIDKRQEKALNIPAEWGGRTTSRGATLDAQQDHLQRKKKGF